MSKPVLGYYNLRGLGQPIRLMLAYSNIPFEEKLYADPTEWQNEKSKLGLDFPNLPYWIEGELKLTETRAILKYLAREKKKDLYPHTPAQERKADMIEGVLYDLQKFLYELAYREIKQNYEEKAPAKFQQIVAFMANNNFLFGDKMSYLDFVLYELLYQYSVHCPTYFNAYPTLLAYKKNFEEIPGIKAYMHSPHYINGPVISDRAIIKF